MPLFAEQKFGKALCEGQNLYRETFDQRFHLFFSIFRFTCIDLSLLAPEKMRKSFRVQSSARFSRPDNTQHTTHNTQHTHTHTHTHTHIPQHCRGLAAVQAELSPAAPAEPEPAEPNRCGGTRHRLLDIVSFVREAILEGFLSLFHFQFFVFCDSL